MDRQEIVLRLKEKQEELGIELDGDLARLLGITHSYLSLLYSGKRQPGAKVIMAMLKLWPDVFRGDGGNGGDRKGDQHHGGTDHGGPGEMDSPGTAGDPCTTRPVD